MKLERQTLIINSSNSIALRTASSGALRCVAERREALFPTFISRRGDGAERGES